LLRLLHGPLPNRSRFMRCGPSFACFSLIVSNLQHGDHLDYLVHSTLTGELHLEHPANCNDCSGGGGRSGGGESTNIHGSFTFVGTRTLSSPTTTSGSNNNTNNDHHHHHSKHKKKGIRVHFFQVSPRPFSFTTLFEPESERVTAAIRIINPACCNGISPCPKPCCSTGICTMMMTGTTIVEAAVKSACSSMTGKCCTTTSQKVAAAPDVSKQEEEPSSQKSCGSKGKCSSSSNHNQTVEPNESTVEAHGRISIQPACCNNRSDGGGSCSKPCRSTGTCNTMGTTFVQAVKSACYTSGNCNSKVVSAAAAAPEVTKEELLPKKSCCSKAKCSSNQSVEPRESILDAPPCRVNLHPGCCSSTRRTGNSDGTGPCPKIPCCATGSCSTTIGATAVTTTVKSAGCAINDNCSSSSSKDVSAEGTKESSNNNNNNKCCSKGKCGQGVVEQDCSNETFSIVTDGIDRLQDQKGLVAVEETTTTSGRSSFYVAKICCASEIPAIHSIVNPMNGTGKVSINVTTKMVRNCTILLWTEGTLVVS
jgi:hypothetical protein